MIDNSCDILTAFKQCPTQRKPGPWLWRWRRWQCWVKQPSRHHCPVWGCRNDVRQFRPVRWTHQCADPASKERWREVQSPGCQPPKGQGWVRQSTQLIRSSAPSPSAHNHDEGGCREHQRLNVPAHSWISHSAGTSENKIYSSTLQTSATFWALLCIFFHLASTGSPPCTYALSKKVRRFQMQLVKKTTHSKSSNTPETLVLLNHRILYICHALVTNTVGGPRVLLKYTEVVFFF